MLTAVQRLKIALMTEGLKVSPLAGEALAHGDASQPLTLAEYATTSGIALRLGSNVWVNAPTREHNPNFVVNPPHCLEYDNETSTFFVRSGPLEVQAKPIPIPSYYDRTNRWGEKHASYAITHTDRVRVSPIEGCAITNACIAPLKALLNGAWYLAMLPMLPTPHVPVDTK